LRQRRLRLVHKAPAIVSGSEYYDRDDVGTKLAALGLAHYLPSDLPGKRYEETFEL
jgi:hypothetical protein